MGYPWISQDTIFVAAYCPLRVGFLQFRHSQSGASTGKLLSITLQGKVWTFVHFRHEKLTTCVYQNLAHTCPYPYHTMHILYSCTSILCESMWCYLAQDQSLSDLPFISLSQTGPNWVCKDGKVPNPASPFSRIPQAITAIVQAPAMASPASPTSGRVFDNANASSAGWSLLYPWHITWGIPGNLRRW